MKDMKMFVERDMGMKKNILKITMGIIMSATILAACGTTPNGRVTENTNNEVIETQEQESSDIASTEEAEDNMEDASNVQEDNDEQEHTEEGFAFSELSNVQFWFSSGAGAWGTDLNIAEDGTFEGVYSDSDMGDTGDGYPNGTHYSCVFTGKFTKPVKVNEYTYSMEIENMVYADEPGTEEIIDGVKYCYSDAYGLTDGKEFLIYLPGSPVDELPEEYLSWINHSMYGEDNKTTLPFYGIYNVEAQCGFGSNGTMKAEMSDETTATSMSDEMAEELAAVEAAAALIEEELQSDINQTQLNDAANRLYETWDNELNSIWARLKEQMPEDEFETLLEEQREWISNKEEAVKNAGAEYEGGSIQPLIEYKEAAEITKKRVYELAELVK